MREYDRCLRDGQCVPHHIGRDVREIDKHSESVHLLNDCTAEFAETVVADGEAAALILNLGGVGPVDRGG